MKNTDSAIRDSRVLSFFDLRAYESACDLDLEIFKLSKEFPKEEMYSLTDQVRRSSRSIGANIAEAWGKRAYIAHFRSKLTRISHQMGQKRI
jgi:four helix bundle protein